MNKKVYAIILAGGSGTRLNTVSSKQFTKICDITILEHSILAFERNKLVDEIIIVINDENLELAEKLVNEKKFKKVRNIVPGGETRQKSSFKGLSVIENDDSLVLIHDAARPLVSQQIIDGCIKELKNYNAVVPVIRIPDTVASIDPEKNVAGIHNRNYLRRIQTPQGFNTGTIKKAHEIYIKNGILEATDDCMLVVNYELANVHTIEGSEDNIKITYQGDVEIAERIYKQRRP